MDMQFLHLERLGWLWVIPVVVIAVIWQVRRRAQRRSQLASARLHTALMPDANDARTWWRAVLWVIALLAMIAASIDPRWGSEYEEVPQSGLDVLIALDTSRSMLAADASPNRLERAKVQIGDLVRQMRGDRVGLMTFAGKPTLRCPLTTDYGAFLMTLNDAEPELEARGGSLLGDVMRAAPEGFTDTVKDHKALVIFTDGEDQGSYPEEAAAALFNDYGVRVFTIGIGDADQGARIPTGRRDGPRFMMYNGQEVWSRMDGAMLRAVALAGGGAFVPAGTRIFPVESFYTDSIATLTGRELEAARIKRYHVRYQMFIAVALFCVLLEGMIIDRRRRPATANWSVQEALA
ncbi:MAG: VWA domain-containing protein [Phycisphaerales bacterium]|nr:VWA domain-containing protein [Phycisphaerales bacterium]